MSQNRSTAVMARRSVAADGLDYFPTPPWGTRALCEVVLGGREALSGLTVWEPACGEGHMARPLAEYFGTVYASDVYPHGHGEVGDFLGTELAPGWQLPGPVDWIVTNPPYHAGEAFARRALSVARVGVAMLLRSAWLEGVERDLMFQAHPLSIYAPFIERLAMVEGKLDRKASSATAYAWFVWVKGAGDTRLVRIPPGSKRRFDRDEDWRRVGASVESTPLFGGVAA